MPLTIKKIIFIVKDFLRQKCICKTKLLFKDSFGVISFVEIQLSTDISTSSEPLRHFTTLIITMLTENYNLDNLNHQRHPTVLLQSEFIFTRSRSKSVHWKSCLLGVNR